MRDIIELAIEQEAERLDAVLEYSEVFEQPLSPWRNSRDRWHPQTRNFSARGISRRRLSPRTTTPPQYVN